MAKTRAKLPIELQRLRTSEWERVLAEANLSEECLMIARMYLLRGIPQEMIADKLQEHGVYLSRPTVTRRCREIIERAQWVANEIRER